MRVLENTKPGVLLGKLRAHDPDQDQRLTFYSDDPQFQGPILQF